MEHDFEYGKNKVKKDFNDLVAKLKKGCVCTYYIFGLNNLSPFIREVSAWNSKNEGVGAINVMFTLYVGKYSGREMAGYRAILHMINSKKGE